MNAVILTSALICGQFVYEPPATDAGYGYGLSGGVYCTALGEPYWWCRQWLGAGFTVQDDTLITGVEALFQSGVELGGWEAAEGMITVGLYAGETIPTTLLDSWQIGIESGIETTWRGLQDLDLQIAAGTYFFTFEVAPESKFIGGIRAGSELIPILRPGGPNNRDSDWIQTTEIPIMLRIYGSEENQGLGDYNSNGRYDSEDIDLLSQAILDGVQDLQYDLDFSGSVNLFDRLEWLTNRSGGILAGDANVDGLFNSRDMIEVFQAGLFETNERALWSDGDWTGNGTFATDDLIAAFQTGRYEQPAAIPVSELSSFVLFVLGFVLLVLMRQRL